MLGGGGIVEVRGEFVLHAERIADLPTLPPGAVPLIERFVVAMIVPMIQQSGHAVSELLDGHG